MYEKEYKKILKNKKYFEHILDLVNSNKNSDDIKLQIAKYACKFATLCPTGYFYSNTLEKYFVDIAQNLHIDLSKDYLKDSCLHVMTTAYTSGGHTRVVERWLKLFDRTSKQSVVLINQEKNIIPEELKNNVKLRNGELIIIDSDLPLIEKALQLRLLASNYDYVVLHTHMDDPVATIAFGTEGFNRPVILFNHADHMFWIGRTIADLVLDMRKYKSITKTFRNIEGSKICPIPQEQTEEFPNKNISREKLNLSKEEKIILLSGSYFKFNAICEDSISDVLECILKIKSQVKIIILGCKKNQKEFKAIKRKYHKNIIIKTKVPFEEYRYYVSSADLVIDSYPCSGGVTLIDATNAHVPYLSLDTLIGQMDSVANTLGFCTSKEELIKKALKVLSDNSYANEIYESEKDLLNKYSNIDAWIDNLESIIKTLPKTHTLRKIELTNAPNFINDYSVVLNSMYNRKNGNYKSIRKRVRKLTFKNWINRIFKLNVN